MLRYRVVAKTHINFPRDSPLFNIACQPVCPLLKSPAQFSAFPRPLLRSLFPCSFLRSTPPTSLSPPSPLFYAPSVHFSPTQPFPQPMHLSSCSFPRTFFTCSSVPPTASRGPALLSSIVQYCLLWLLLLLLSYCPAHLPLLSSHTPAPPGSASSNSSFCPAHLYRRHRLSFGPAPPAPCSLPPTFLLPCPALPCPPALSP